MRLNRRQEIAIWVFGGVLVVGLVKESLAAQYAGWSPWPAAMLFAAGLIIALMVISALADRGQEPR